MGKLMFDGEFLDLPEADERLDRMTAMEACMEWVSTRSLHVKDLEAQRAVEARDTGKIENE